MYYIFVNDNIVCEMIPEENPIFPGVPICERYTAEFLSRCIQREEVEGIGVGMLYDPGTGAFSQPERAPQAEPEETVQTARLDAAYSEGVESCE